MEFEAESVWLLVGEGDSAAEAGCHELSSWANDARLERRFRLARVVTAAGVSGMKNCGCCCGCCVGGGACGSMESKSSHPCNEVCAGTEESG